MGTAVTSREFSFRHSNGSTVSIPKGTLATWQVVTVVGSCGGEEHIVFNFEGDEYHWEVEHKDHVLYNMGFLPVAASAHNKQL